MSTTPVGHADRSNRDGGFTLIELMLVVVIIGILVAMAIPRYLSYQEGSHDKAAASDLRSSVSALQLCYGYNHDNFPASITFAGGYGTPSAASCAQIPYSNETIMTYTPAPSGCTDATCRSFVLTATSSGGTGKTYTYDSTAGGGIH